jgi:hypothetical protein
MTMPILDDLPDPTRLGFADLRRLRDLFQGVATTAASQADDVLAQWARVIADGYSFELNARARGRRESRRALLRYLAEYRQQHPYSEPGDITGLPSWREISGPPDE